MLDSYTIDRVLVYSFNKKNKMGVEFLKILNFLYENYGIVHEIY